MLPEHRPPVLGDVRDALVSEWGGNWGLGVLNQWPISGEAAETIARAIRSHLNDLECVEASIEQYLVEAMPQPDLAIAASAGGTEEPGSTKGAAPDGAEHGSEESQLPSSGVAVWLVRAGSRGELEQRALEQGLSIIGWPEMPDLSHVASREELRALIQRTYPNASVSKVSNSLGQLWAFRERMQDGDLVVLPSKSRAAIAIGRVTGPYQYRPDMPGGGTHVRPTKWLRTDIPRAAFGQDLLYSFGAFMTVCQITRNNAQQRIQAVLEGKPDQVVSRPKPPDDARDESEEESLDLETYARDQIMDHIGRSFRGHDLSRLVNDLLRAQGYRTQFSLPGPDGGVDIIAGAGPMGFDLPRLCVQVKSSDTPVDVGVLRELQGVMRNFGAQQGLLVSWGGFKNTVLEDSRRLFFEVRLWDAGDIISALLQHYDQLPEDIQAELPLKRIWVLVPNEVER